MFARVALACLLVRVVAACEQAPSSGGGGVAPPAAGEPVLGLCRGGGGVVDDEISAGFFPRVVGKYCLDPNGQARNYGKSARGTLEEGCDQHLGQCELYRSYGLERLVSVRYADGAGTTASVLVMVSTFATTEGAFGFYTGRVVAGADPSGTQLVEVPASGQAVVGVNSAVLWSGSHVAELNYADPAQAPEQLRASANAALTQLVASMNLPGGADKPAAVLSLPVESRLPLGVEFVRADALGVSGAGAAAIGYYAQGGRRWRVLVIQRGDEDSARDVIKTLRRSPSLLPLKDAPDGVFSLFTRTSDSAPRVDWIVGARGASVVAIGDEEYVLATAPNAEERARVSLSYTEKLALLQSILRTPVAL